MENGSFCADWTTCPCSDIPCFPWHWGTCGTASMCCSRLLLWCDLIADYPNYISQVRTFYSKISLHCLHIKPSPYNCLFSQSQETEKKCQREILWVFCLAHTCRSSPQHMTWLIKSVTLISLIKRDILKMSLIKKYLNELDCTMEFWYTDQFISSPVQNQMRQFGKHTDTEPSKTTSAWGIS